MSTPRPFAPLMPLAAAALFFCQGAPPSSAQTAYQQAVLDTNPVLYWTFDEADDFENARSLVDDQFENELAPLGAATRAPSATTAGGADLGRAARFDYNEDPQSRFHAVNLAPFEPLTRFAVEFWFLLEDDMTNRYFSEMFSESAQSNQPAMIYNFNAGELELFGGGRTGATASSGEWHHVVAAFYGSGEGVEIYLDGELAESIDREGGFSQVHSFGEFAIGNTVRNPQSINGMIDEYAIYDLDGFDDLEARQAHVLAIAAHHGVGGTSFDPKLQAPSSVNLGLVTVGTPSISGEIAVSNLGAAQTLNLTGLTFGAPDGARFSLAPATTFPIAIPPGGSGVVGVVFTSDGEPGSYSTVATLASNDPQAPEKTITLSVTVRPPDPPPATPYQEAVVGHQPVLYWTFDEEGEFDNALSLVDNQPANELTPLGAATRAASTTTAGGADLGRAARFDYNEDPASRFHAVNLARTQPLTRFAVEFWFMLEDDMNDRYFSEMFSEAAQPNQPGMIYNYNPEELELFGGGRTGTPVSSGEWHHVVAASYGGGEGVEIYIDGELAESIDREGGFSQVHSFGEFAIGNTVRNPHCINGLIDEYAIYDLDGFDNLAARQAHVLAIAGHFRVSAGEPGGDTPFHITAAARVQAGEAVNFDITFTSQPGRTYAIHTSPDLHTWTELNGNVASGGAATTFRDTRDLSGIPALYYFVKENSP